MPCNATQLSIGQCNLSSDDLYFSLKIFLEHMLLNTTYRKELYVKQILLVMHVFKTFKNSERNKIKNRRVVLVEYNHH